ncbi:hypothetical protein [Listeria monocytogenes]|nr:hypothetical protein [Listeria monocytogenes]
MKRNDVRRTIGTQRMRKIGVIELQSRPPNVLLPKWLQRKI